MFLHRSFFWLVLAGLFVAFGAPGLLHRSGNSPDRINDTAFFGGVEHRVQSSDFRGGEVTAIMGGVKLDLRDAETTRDEVTVEATALMGGVEIIAPRDWEVEVSGTSILGGFEDKRSFRTSAEKGRPRLIVTGTAIMGGVSIRR